eukprot:1151964-Pelagomonas_calceolata.AAC.4
MRQLKSEFHQFPGIAVQCFLLSPPCSTSISHCNTLAQYRNTLTALASPKVNTEPYFEVTRPQASDPAAIVQGLGQQLVFLAFTCANSSAQASNDEQKYMHKYWPAQKGFRQGNPSRNSTSFHLGAAGCCIARASSLLVELPASDVPPICCWYPIPTTGLVPMGSMGTAAQMY